MVRKDNLIQIAKRLCSNNLRSDLFAIPLLYTSSLFLLIDRKVIYLGEIYASDNEKNGTAVSVVCDEQSRLLLIRLAFQHVDVVVKTNKVHGFEGSINVVDEDTLAKGYWTLNLIISKIGEIVEVGE